MENFKGVKCSICEKEFNKGEKIVVCPECGTPYHKLCYNKVDGCLFSAQHGEYIFQKPNNQKSEKKELEPGQDEGEEKKIKCPHCLPGYGRKSINLCENCRRPLDTMKYMTFLFKSHSVENILEYKKLLGINVNDWISFLGPNAPSYFMKFKSIEDTKEYMVREFIWGAFFFQELYFFYRKMYFVGILVFLIRIALMIFIAILFINYHSLHNVIYNELLEVYKLSNSQVLLAEKINGLMLKYRQLFDYIEGAWFTMAVLLGATAARIYKRVAIKRIKDISKQEFIHDIYYKEALEKKGSVSYVIMIAMAMFILLKILIIYGGAA